MEEQKTPTLEELQALIEMTNTLNMEIFYWWCIALMVCIHAGFLSYEIGASRLKNALAAGVKNILAFGFIVPSVFLLGWAVYNGFPDGLVPRMDAFLAGMPWSESMGPNIQDNATGIFWAAFAMFAATTGSILSGALIERARMSAFIILTIVLGGFLWLVAASWGWHPEGWLTVKWGYHDVGAAGVVHLIAGFFALAVVINLGARIGLEATGPQQGAGRQTDEAVAPKALATHHGFEQEAVLAAVLGVRQLQVERERGFQVRKGLDHERNAVVAFAGQAFEFKFCDHGEGSQLSQRASPG